MKSLTLFIPGNPIQQGRARATVINRRNRAPFVQIYDPPESEAYKKQVRQLAQLQLKENLPAWRPLEGPLSVSITFYIGRERIVGDEKKLQIFKGKYPVQLPDIDNYVKAALDGLSKVLWDDDKCIIELERVRKLFADGHESGFEILVRPYGQEEFNAVQDEIFQNQKT